MSAADVSTIVVDAVASSTQRWYLAKVASDCSHGEAECDAGMSRLKQKGGVT